MSNDKINQKIVELKNQCAKYLGESQMRAGRNLTKFEQIAKERNII